MNQIKSNTDDSPSIWLSADLLLLTFVAAHKKKSLQYAVVVYGCVSVFTIVILYKKHVAKAWFKKYFPWEFPYNPPPPLQYPPEPTPRKKKASVKDA